MRAWPRHDSGECRSSRGSSSCSRSRCSVSRSGASSRLARPIALGWAIAIFGATPTVVAFLFPAFLFLRHPRVWSTDRVLAFGVVLFGVVEVLQYIAPGLSGWFTSLIPPPVDMPFLAPLDVAFTVVVGILAAMAPIYTGRGLVAARAYEDEPGSRKWWLIVALVTVVAGVTNVLLLVNVSLDVPDGALVAYFWLTVLSVALSLLSVFGWAYLAGAGLIGWRSGEEPLRGWLLAALAAGLRAAGVRGEWRDRGDRRVRDAAPQRMVGRDPCGVRGGVCAARRGLLPRPAGDRR